MTDESYADLDLRLRKVEQALADLRHELSGQALLSRMDRDLAKLDASRKEAAD